MPDELGPFITPSMIFISAFYVYALPARFWFNGHLDQLELRGVKFTVSTWMFYTTSDGEITKQIKPYYPYIWKGIGWFFNALWVLFLLSEPGCGRWTEQPCAPIFSNAAFHNIALLDIGGIVVELVLFFALTGYFRWRVIREK